MNKYVILGIVLVVIIAGGVIFSATDDSFKCDPSMGKDVEMTVVSKKLEWAFEPEEITIAQCDRVKVTVINEDNFDHGFAIDAFGISQRLPASESIVVEFVATKAGTFPFYCSVSCSSSDAATFGLPDGEVQTGPYTGTVRGHFEHIGQYIVNIFSGNTDTN